MRNRRGYTLVELVVVVMIIGILASFGVPQYLRTVESTKAEDAVSAVSQIGMTNRMFALDHGGFYAAGAFPAGVCTGGGVCPANVTANVAACALVWCKYLSDQDWGAKPYQFYACAPSAAGCGGIAGANPVAGARRKNGGSPGTDYDPYARWGYIMNSAGVISGSPASGANAAPTPTY